MSFGIKWKGFWASLFPKFQMSLSCSSRAEVNVALKLSMYIQFPVAVHTEAEREVTLRQTQLDQKP